MSLLETESENSGEERPAEEEEESDFYSSEEEEEDEEEEKSTNIQEGNRILEALLQKDDLTNKEMLQAFLFGMNQGISELKLQLDDQIKETVKDELQEVIGKEKATLKSHVATAMGSEIHKVNVEMKKVESKREEQTEALKKEMEEKMEGKHQTNIEEIRREFEKNRTEIQSKFKEEDEFQKLVEKRMEEVQIAINFYSGKYEEDRKRMETIEKTLQELQERNRPEDRTDIDEDALERLKRTEDGWNLYLRKQKETI
jgi:hypothetical protein